MDPLFPLNTTIDEQSGGAEIAVLPVGSLEQHGPFLPISTDSIIACVIAREISASYPIRLLSPITISCSHEHSAWQGTVSISAPTLHGVISDIRDSLQQSGISKLAIINAHGGNYVLRNIVQESNVSGIHMALFPGSADWVRARIQAGMSTNDHEDMHAGELETSILLHSFPSVVRDGYEQADHIANERPGLLTLGLKAYTTSGVIGRPSQASSTKGKAAIESLVQSFASCITTLAS